MTPFTWVITDTGNSQFRHYINNQNNCNPKRDSHGDRLSATDKKRVARDIASTDRECRWTETALAEKLGVTHQTVNIWISDIRARQKASRDTVILRLSRFACPPFYRGDGPRKEFLKQWG